MTAEYSPIERYEDAVASARDCFTDERPGVSLYHLGRAAELAERQREDSLGTSPDEAEAWSRHRKWADQLARTVEARVSAEKIEMWRHKASGELVRSISTPRADRLELFVEEDGTVEWQDVSGQEYCLCGTGADFQSLESGWRRECPSCGLVLTRVITDE